MPHLNTTCPPPTKIYYCTFCGQSFQTTKHIYQHNKLKHSTDMPTEKDEIWLCMEEQCNYITHNPIKVKTHYEIHHFTIPSPNKDMFMSMKIGNLKLQLQQSFPPIQT